MRRGVDDIRERQDMLNLDTHEEITCNTELRQYAIYLLSGGLDRKAYPKTWRGKWKDVDGMGYEHQLTEAGAYIAAEIDRIRLMSTMHERYERTQQENKAQYQERV